MNILPYKKISIKSDLSKDEVLSLLSENCQTARIIIPRIGNWKIFEGGVLGDKFEFYRAYNPERVTLRSSFSENKSAVANGVVYSSNDGSIIVAKMTQPYFTMLFIPLFVSYIIYMAFAALFESEDIKGFVALIFMASASYILPLLMFAYESNFLEKDLIEIIRGKKL